MLTHLEVGDTLVTVILVMKLSVELRVELEPGRIGPVCVVEPRRFRLDISEILVVVGIISNEAWHPSQCTWQRYDAA